MTERERSLSSVYPLVVLGVDWCRSDFSLNGDVNTVLREGVEFLGVPGIFRAAHFLMSVVEACSAESQGQLCGVALAPDT